MKGRAGARRPGTEGNVGMALCLGQFVPQRGLGSQGPPRFPGPSSPSGITCPTEPRHARRGSRARSHSLLIGGPASALLAALEAGVCTRVLQAVPSTARLSAPSRLRQQEPGLEPHSAQGRGPSGRQAGREDASWLPCLLGGYSGRGRQQEAAIGEHREGGGMEWERAQP